LIEKKADINWETYDGDNPLIIAIQEQNPEIVKYLIEKGAQIM